MTFGQADVVIQRETSEAESTAILDKFYQAGGNFLDTANGYQSDEFERRIGCWMTERDKRHEMVIATKCTTPYMGAHPERLFRKWWQEQEAIPRRISREVADFIRRHHLRAWVGLLNLDPRDDASFDDLVVIGP